MSRKIIITKMQTRLPNGDIVGATAKVALSNGKSLEWSGKLGDGEAYNGGEIPEGVQVVSSNSDGLFAWTILEDAKEAPAPAPEEPAGPARKARKARNTIAKP